MTPGKLYFAPFRLEYTPSKLNEVGGRKGLIQHIVSVLSHNPTNVSGLTFGLHTCRESNYLSVSQRLSPRTSDETDCCCDLDKINVLILLHHPADCHHLGRVLALLLVCSFRASGSRGSELKDHFLCVPKGENSNRENTTSRNS